MRIAYDSIAELARLAASETMTIGQLVLEEQAEQLGRTKEQLLAVLDEDLTVMEQAARRGGQKDVHSHSGLTGGDGWRMSQYAQAGQTLSGPLAACAMAIAISVAEYNAAMGRIVASPTAGSCGILPGAVLVMMEHSAEPVASRPVRRWPRRAALAWCWPSRPALPGQRAAARPSAAVRRPWRRLPWWS